MSTGGAKKEGAPSGGFTFDCSSSDGHSGQLHHQPSYSLTQFSGCSHVWSVGKQVACGISGQNL